MPASEENFCTFLIVVLFVFGFTGGGIGDGCSEGGVCGCGGGGSSDVCGGGVKAVQEILVVLMVMKLGVVMIVEVKGLWRCSHYTRSGFRWL